MSDIPNALTTFLAGRRSGTSGTPGPHDRATVVRRARFLALARELTAQIVPVRPRQEFRDALQHDLIKAARPQYAHDLLLFSASPADQNRPSRRWVFSAATIGSAVSLAGIAAYVWLHRHRQAA